MMDLRLRLTLVAKAALCGALFLTSFCIAPEALSMVILLSLEQTYFYARELFCFGLDRLPQVTLVLRSG